MADILIRMEMPKDCYTCSFRTTVGLDEWMCMVNKMRFPSWESGWNGDTYRHENCPLHELPEHGDLISRKEALSMPFANDKYDHKNADEHFIYGCETYKEWLEQLPVVISSNKEDTK